MAEGRYQYTAHALARTTERRISRIEIEQAIAAAEIIEEYADDKYGPSCLLYGDTHKGRPLHVLVSCTPSPVKIISAYQPDPAESCEERKMSSECNVCRGRVDQQLTTYTQWFEDRPIVIENVPAWVCAQCGETYYDPDVVEQVQTIIWSHQPPVRVVETPVYDLKMA